MSSRPSRKTSGSEGFRERVIRTGPLAIMTGVAAAGAVCGSSWTAALGPWPWIVSLVFVGLPHGASDFAVSRSAWRGLPLAAVWLIYLAAMTAVAACFIAAPLATMCLFAIASCWHFGVSHLDTDAACRRRGLRTARAMARGCMVLAVPLLAWPAATVAVAANLAAFAIGSDATASLFSTQAVRAAGICLAVMGGIALAAEARSEWSRSDGLPFLRRLLVEAAVIIGLGWFADPLLSVGVYFLVWHAWRQMEPLAESLSAPRGDSWRSLGAAIVRVHVASLPLLLPSLVAIGAAWWAWAPEHTLRSLAITSIGAYLIVTPAHELLGELLRIPAISPALARFARHGPIRHAGA